MRSMDWTLLTCQRDLLATLRPRSTASLFMGRTDEVHGDGASGQQPTLSASEKRILLVIDLKLSCRFLWFQKF